MVELKPLPPTDAIRAFEARKPNMVGTFSYQDMWQEEYATSFTVAKSAGFDILTDLFDGLERSLKEGRTVRDFSRDLRPVLQAKGWWGKQLVTDPDSGDLVAAQLGSTRRLQTIFDANMRVSYAAGHWAGFEQNKRGRPFLRYVALLDDRTRPAHRARHNLVLSVDDPYWDYWAPPCGWNCRCTLQSLSQRDIDRLIREGEQLMFVAPQDTFRNFLNKRTGEIVKVPDGIDPGWAYNPGRAGYEARVNQALAEKIADAPSEFVAAAVEERVGSTAFERFVTRPQGSMPVMVVSDDIAKAAGTNARVALLSAEVMTKQRASFPELTIDDYRALPSLGFSPSIVVQEADRTVFLARVGADLWRYAVVQIDADRKAAFVASFRYARTDAIRIILARQGIRVIFDNGQGDGLLPT